MVPSANWRIPVTRKGFLIGDSMEKEPQPKFVVRTMTVDDVEEATAMRLQSWRDTYRNDELRVTAEWLEDIIAGELTSERIVERKERFRTGDSIGWIARDASGKIVGVSMPHVMEDGTQRLGGLYVDKDWHGKGVGSSLIQKTLAWHDSTKPIVLGVATYNERAKAFYRKWGFEEVPNSVELFRDKIPTVHMVRRALNSQKETLTADERA